MESNYEALKLISNCSSILHYKANESMPISIVYDYLGINEKSYIILCNGRILPKNDAVKEGDEVMALFKIAKSLEQEINI